jgi:hypothetical protein
VTVTVTVTANRFGSQPTETAYEKHSAIQPDVFGFLSKKLAKLISKWQFFMAND